MNRLIKAEYDRLDIETKKKLGKSSSSQMVVDDENAIVHNFENGVLIYDKKRQYALSIYGTLFVFWKELGEKEFSGNADLRSQNRNSGRAYGVCCYFSKWKHPLYPLLSLKRRVVC